MTITAILSALAEEQQGLVELLENSRCVRRADREFWLGRLHGQDVVLALSRYGKVAAATTATTLIESFGVQRIVFTGVAGGVGAGVKVGDIVVATAMSSMTWMRLPCFPVLKFPCTDGLVLTAMRI